MLTEQMLSYVQCLMLAAGGHGEYAIGGPRGCPVWLWHRLERIEAYLIERYNRE